MTGLALVTAAGQPVRLHAPRGEYAAWLQDATDSTAATRQIRDYDQFVARWPDLERWFTAPLLPRLGCGTDIPETSTDAGL